MEVIHAEKTGEMGMLHKWRHLGTGSTSMAERLIPMVRRLCHRHTHAGPICSSPNALSMVCLREWCHPPAVRL